MATGGVPSTRLDGLWVELAQQMELTHSALLSFHGEEFAKHASEEMRICGLIEGEVNPTRGSAIPEQLQRLMRVRRHLLRSTRRTVSALRGACEMHRCTYDPTMNGGME